MCLPNWPAADVDKEKCKASEALLSMGPSQKAVGRGLFLGVWSAQSKEVLPSLTSLAHTPNLIFLYSSGKSRLEGDFLQPQEGIPKAKTEVLKLLSSCALSQLCSDHPEILEEDWDA